MLRVLRGGGRGGGETGMCEFDGLMEGKEGGNESGGGEMFVNDKLGADKAFDAVDGVMYTVRC